VYQAIYFDAGSTVLHSHPRQERNRLSLLSLGFSVEEDRLREMMGWAHEQIWPEMREVRTVEREAQVWRRYYRVLLEALGIPEGDDAFVEELQERAFYGRWTAVYPDVHGCLELLQGLGYRLGLISNALPSLRQVLEDIGLARHFDSIVVSALVGVRKPDEDIYRLALEDLGASPEEAVFVDDMIENVVAAQALGFTAFLIDRHGHQGSTEWDPIPDLGEVVSFAAQRRGDETTS